MTRLQNKPQTDPSNDRQGQISLWLRVGVVGHRNVSPDRPGLMYTIDTVLASLAHLQASIPVMSTCVGLTVVSSLAEGADRILAHAVLAREGTRLEVILPLDPKDYRRDFKTLESRDDFDYLTDKASVDVIPPKKSRVDAYEAAGHAVVDRSDVIIVVWDGEAARGRGDTADIYAYAVMRKKPIFWIRIDSESTELAEAPPDLDASNVLLGPEALEHLDRYNREHLPASIFTEAPPLLTDLSTREDDSAASTAALLVQDVGRYLVRADALAQRFQRRWFWVARLVYALTALAVAIVAAQILYAPGRDWFAWFEFAALVCVTIVAFLAPFDHWRYRWTSTGYLAEQIRSLVFVGLAGLDTPDDVIFAAGPYADLLRESSWTQRAIAEIWWPRPRYDLTDNVNVLRNVLSKEWRDQLRYHRSTSRKMKERSERFTVATLVLFMVSVVAALLHSLGVGPEIVRPATPWDYLSIIIPAIAAAISGYAAQRNYERRSERESRLAVLLMDARYQLDEAKDLNGIQNVVLKTRGLMRSETFDWYSIVQSRHLEP
jgi:hypothetical protein